jgi:type III pantothenate kinase
MLLVIDVGNTNTVLGIYDGSSLIRDWRIRTERNTTEDELNVLLSSLLASGGIERARIERSIISCVVPPVVKILDAFCRRYLGHAPRWVDARSVGMMPIRYNNPAEIGADRIVNAIAAYHKYRCSLIAIDFGTATTFDVISEKGEYLGGAISPGIMISAEALFRKASKLPRVEIFTPPQTAIGKDTISSIQAGIIFGYAAMVDGMVRRMKAELDTSPRVIATGGLADLMVTVAETIEVTEKNLTLEGLRLLSQRLEDDAS